MLLNASQNFSQTLSDFKALTALRAVILYSIAQEKHSI
jgi:hypothetical protein